jgi:hypothetical protein
LHDPAPEREVFALGHSRRFDSRPLTSDLPLETDIVRAGRHVSNVPTTEVIGPRQNMVRMAGRDAGAFAVAEHDGPAMFARIGVIRALNRHVERVFNPSRKEPH